MAACLLSMVVGARCLRERRLEDGAEARGGGREGVPEVGESGTFARHTGTGTFEERTDREQQRGSALAALRTFMGKRVKMRAQRGQILMAAETILNDHERCDEFSKYAAIQGLAEFAQIAQMFEGNTQLMQMFGEELGNIFVSGGKNVFEGAENGGAEVIACGAARGRCDAAAREACRTGQCGQRFVCARLREDVAQRGNMAVTLIVNFCEECFNIFRRQMIVDRELGDEFEGDVEITHGAEITGNAGKFFADGPPGVVWGAGGEDFEGCAGAADGNAHIVNAFGVAAFGGARAVLLGARELGGEDARDEHAEREGRARVSSAAAGRMAALRRFARGLFQCVAASLFEQLSRRGCR